MYNWPSRLTKAVRKTITALSKYQTSQRMQQKGKLNNTLLCGKGNVWRDKHMWSHHKRWEWKPIREQQVNQWQHYFWQECCYQILNAFLIFNYYCVITHVHWTEHSIQMTCLEISDNAHTITVSVHNKWFPMNHDSLAKRMCTPE